MCLTRSEYLSLEPYSACVAGRMEIKLQIIGFICETHVPGDIIIPWSRQMVIDILRFDV